MDVDAGLSLAIGVLILPVEPQEALCRGHQYAGDGFLPVAKNYSCTLLVPCGIWCLVTCGTFENLSWSYFVRAFSDLARAATSRTSPC